VWIGAGGVETKTTGGGGGGQKAFNDKKSSAMRKVRKYAIEGATVKRTGGGQKGQTKTTELQYQGVRGEQNWTGGSVKKELEKYSDSVVGGEKRYGGIKLTMFQDQLFSQKTVSLKKETCRILKKGDLNKGKNLYRQRALDYPK